MILDLWLSILLAAIAVFLVSAVVHMVLPIHWNDYVKLPAEDELLASMRGVGLAPGSYVFPRPDSVKEMASPEMRARYDRGPVGSMTILPNGMPNMGKSLLQWFLFCIVVGVVVAHVTGLACAPGAGFGRVFHVASLVAFLGYGFSSVNDSIWKGIRWGVTTRFVVDGLLYGLATGAVFGWLWPAGQ